METLQIVNKNYVCLENNYISKNINIVTKNGEHVYTIDLEDSKPIDVNSDEFYIKQDNNNITLKHYLQSKGIYGEHDTKVHIKYQYVFIKSGDIDDFVLINGNTEFTPEVDFVPEVSVNVHDTVLILNTDSGSSIVKQYKDCQRLFLDQEIWFKSPLCSSVMIIKVPVERVYTDICTNYADHEYMNSYLPDVFPRNRKIFDNCPILFDKISKNLNMCYKSSKSKSSETARYTRSDEKILVTVILVKVVQDICSTDIKLATNVLDSLYMSTIPIDF